MEQPNPLTNNQLLSGEGEGNYTWKSQPQFIKCQGCGFEGDTSITKEFNKKNTLLCIVCAACYYAYTAYHLKDHTCFTVTHFCPRCQQKIGTFDPCG